MSGSPAGSTARTALFPGTFDPFTNGHLDLTERAARMFPKVVVAVSHSPRKGTLFSLEDRVALAKEAVKALPNVEVIGFDGLVVDCAKKAQAQVMCRGIRAVSDFEFEFQMALMNRRLNPRIETVFMMPAESYSYLSSRLVKEVFQLGGAVRELVPPVVEKRLGEKYGGQAGPGQVERRRRG